MPDERSASQREAQRQLRYLAHRRIRRSAAIVSFADQSDIAVSPSVRDNWYVVCLFPRRFTDRRPSMMDTLLAGLFDPLGVIVLWGLATMIGIAVTRLLLRLVQGRNRPRVSMGAETITAVTRSP
jgi:hypothetical protein